MNKDILSLWQSQVHNKDELEGVVEREPVGCVDGRLNDGQGSVNNPVLHIIGQLTTMLLLAMRML